MTTFAIAVKAFIVENDKMLVLKRRPDDAQKPNQWDIPGGRLEPGEDPFVGLQRETQEEAHIKIRIEQPLAVRHFTRDDGQTITMIIFLCAPLTKKITLSDEHTEYQWIDITHAEHVLHDWLLSIVQSYQGLYLSHKTAIPSS